MTHHSDPVLDCPPDQVPDATELIEAAMRWHFDERTGSPFWLSRAKTFDFDPRRDVHTPADLALFPNLVDELRDVRVEDLIPAGYGGADVLGVFESGGTTGPPKRVVFLADWIDRLMGWQLAQLERQGIPRNVNWLALAPSGPHIFGELTTQLARRRGGLRFFIDLDPRWVKKCIAAGRADEADRYADHLVTQAGYVLDSQDIGVLVTTPPLLERLARRDPLVKLINERVRAIQWGGAHMDADTRHLLRTEVFGGVALFGMYGSTMTLGGAAERRGLTDDDPCIFDPFSPYISYSVVDPDTHAPVPYGSRGRVVMNHVSKSAFIPNNLERDIATRIAPPAGQVGDSVADVAPVAVFGGEAVIEGVY
jgi:phenylacetate-coenzyme A ligase PaaK-like adenylate-forming protein